MFGAHDSSIIAGLCDGVSATFDPSGYLSFLIHAISPWRIFGYGIFCLIFVLLIPLFCMAVPFGDICTVLVLRKMMVSGLGRRLGVLLIGPSSFLQEMLVK
jgi:hypothetical protein